MHIKRKNFFSAYSFWMEDLDGIPMRLPLDGDFAPNLSQLTELVLGQIRSFDRSTDGKYSEGLRKRAKEKGIGFSQYISALIEHQICLRRPDSKSICYKNGFGDEIHGLISKIDNWVAKSPPIIRSMGAMVTKAATKVATGTASSSFGGCEICGGTKTLSPKKNNLGRKDWLNKNDR